MPENSEIEQLAVQLEPPLSQLTAALPMGETLSLGILKTLTPKFATLITWYLDQQQKSIEDFSLTPEEDSDMSTLISTIIYFGEHRPQPYAFDRTLLRQALNGSHDQLMQQKRG